MKYLLVFNLFCLAAFLQLASRAPLVDEYEQPLEPTGTGRWASLRQLFAMAPIR